MIVYGFGDYFTDCQNTLTGDNYHAFNQVDGIKSARRSLTAPIAGASGAFDFYGSGYWPAEPLSITTEADIMYTTWQASGIAAEALVSALWSKARSKLWLIPDKTFADYRFGYAKPAPADTYLANTYVLSGTVTLSATPVIAPIWLMDSNNQVLSTTTSTTPDGYTFSVPAGSYKVHARYYYAAGTDLSKYYSDTNSVDVSGATTSDIVLALPSSPVMAAERVWWADAKLVSASVVTSVKARNPRSVKIQAEFEIPGGIFYNINAQSATRTESGSKAYTLTNNGNTPTHVKWSLTALTHTITDFRVQNGTSGSDITWSGTLLASDILVLDSSTYTATNDGAAVYTGVVYNAPVTQLGWCVLYPGSNSLTISLTQATTEDYSVTYEFYDAAQP